MSKADDILAKVTEIDTIEDGVIALLTAVHAALVEARASNNPATLDAAIALVDNMKTKAAAAIVANTDAEPPTP